MKKALISIVMVFALSACGSITYVDGDTIYKTPNEDGGLEGNANEDTIAAYDTSKAEALLKKIAKQTYYTYEVSSNIRYSETHFVQYYTPYAFYELNDNAGSSIGYAQEKDTLDLFKYYLSSDMNTVYPSTYEYMLYGDDYEKLYGLYSPIALTNFTLINELEEPDYSVLALSVNRFQVLDSNIASIFQYMTSFGSSITDYIISVYFEIIDETVGSFKATVDLGTYGNITGVYTPYTASTHPLRNVESKIKSGEVKGVDAHEDVYTLFKDKLGTNNYTLSGIKVASNTGGVTSPVYNITCSENYFYFEYLVGSYTDFGYVYVPKNTEVTCMYDLNGNLKTTTYNLPYAGYFEFEKQNDGTFTFTRFAGPYQDEYKYKEVDVLPSTGDSNVLYIVEVDGVKKAYYYTEVTSGTFGFKEYSIWFNSIADYAIDGLSASFYIGGERNANQMARFYEQDRTNPNKYYTTQSDVMSYFANGLFGWGFQGSTTWMDYITDANIEINKNSSGEIISADIGLNVTASVDGSAYGKQRIFYTASDFGTSGNTSVEAFLQAQLGE